MLPLRFTESNSRLYPTSTVATWGRQLSHFQFQLYSHPSSLHWPLKHFFSAILCWYCVRLLFPPYADSPVEHESISYSDYCNKKLKDYIWWDSACGTCMLRIDWLFKKLLFLKFYTTCENFSDRKQSIRLLAGVDLNLITFLKTLSSTMQYSITIGTHNYSQV